MKHLIGISIVNYKTSQLVKECISSLANEHKWIGQFRVVVVDNASGDGSVEKLDEFVRTNGWESWIAIIDSGKNGGYSYGNNIAFRQLLDLRCDLIWMLNPDTRLIEGATQALIDCLDSDSGIGVAGSRLEDHDGTPQVSAFNFPTPNGEFVNTCKLGFLERWFPSSVVARRIPPHRQQVDWVAGASIMLKAEVIQKVGLMDESYFLYFEEVDYCRAITEAGFKIVYEPGSRVIHHVGAATGISDTRKQAPRRPKYWFESRQRYFQKNFGFVATLLADVLWIIAFSSLRCRAVLQGKKLLYPPNFLQDFFLNSSLLKGRCIP